MKLNRHVEIKGTLICETGLRIGGEKGSLDIAILDNPIIRHPLTGEPYVPGSSLKGKVRSLLEMTYSTRSQQTGRPCDCGECRVCKLFGCGDVKNTKEPTRIIFRDAALTKESREELEKARVEKGINFSEVKTEVQMDRKTNTVQRGGLRNMERVPAGTEFAFRASLRVFEGDDMAAVRGFLREGFALLEKDYLGGSGSRGYGKVRLDGLTFDGQPI